ncbi:Protein DMP4 [Cardamine amara subsp. amara]|uniref:Protein DMP4 n=1 Tax=Cardamine amara subsp. amara TaxID=228776 RepID=A0ABD1C0T0_CARAN
MEITVVEDHQKSTKEDIKKPLLEDGKDFPDIERTKWMHKAMSQTFQTTANLANLLPTGTVLAFQILSPIFSNGGQCDLASKIMTTALVAICGFSCFILSFTDSYRDTNGTICYGMATFNGFWIIDGSATLPPELSKTYKLKFIDFAHAFMSLLVFGAVVLFDRNAVNCFFPAPSVEALEVLTELPVGVGVFCSMLFATFPTRRNGIGFPLSSK